MMDISDRKITFLSYVSRPDPKYFQFRQAEDLGGKSTSHMPSPLEKIVV